MFFRSITLYSRILFIGITALQCFLAIMLLRWDAWKRYPVMSVYLTWQAVGGLAGLLIALFGAGMPYFYTYFVVTILLNLIAFAVALELYYKICDPRIGFFAWGRRHVVIIMSVSLVIALTLGRIFAARNGGSLTRTMSTVNEVMGVALWATFCFLLIYSRSLGFTWRPRVAGIAMGFILYRIVSVTCIFLAARLSFNTGIMANQVEMAAEFLAMAWWLGVFWGEEKFPPTLISAQVEEKFPPAAVYGQVEEMPGRYGKNVEAIARML